jgi:hypothetical protein
MWECPKCHEKVDEQFDVCWSCGTTADGVENPGFLDESGASEPGPEQQEVAGVPEHLVTIARCSLPAEAYAIRLRLESAGIPVVLADEFTVTMDWLLANAIGGIKVQVPEEDLGRANRLLSEMESARQAARNDEPAEDAE